MLTLLLVDDEPTVRNGMMNCIAWAAHGCRVVGEACNGAEALEAALRLKPQIILSDIRMPVMDGIELVRQIRRKLPGCRVVIMSGYSEFAYAKRLMGMHVTEYLLKPVSEEELAEVLQRLADEIQQEEQRETHMKAVDRLRYENSPQLKARFMSQIISGGFEDAGKAEKWAEAINMRLSFDGRDMHAIAMAADPFPSRDEADEAQQELLRYAIVNIAEELMQKQGSGFLCYGGGFADFAGLICLKDAQPDTMERMESEIADMVMTYLNIRLFVVIGGAARDMRDISRSYDGALASLNERLCRGKRSFVKIALKYMEEHLEKDIGLAEAARAAHVTPNYLSRIFKEEMNTNFVDWLNQLRINRAKELFRTTHLKVYEVAEQVGYKDYKYFSALFKKMTDVTPREYCSSLKR